MDVLLNIGVIGLFIIGTLTLISALYLSDADPCSLSSADLSTKNTASKTLAWIAAGLSALLVLIVFTTGGASIYFTTIWISAAILLILSLAGGILAHFNHLTYALIILLIATAVAIISIFVMAVFFGREDDEERKD